MRAFTVISTLFSLACAGGQTFESVAKRADAARDTEHLDEAIRLYRQALRIKPAWAEGWWSLGTVFYDTDRHAECAAAFNRFISLKPAVGPAHALLGLCEFGRRNYDLALKHLFKAQELGFAGNQQIRDVALYHTALAL